MDVRWLWIFLDVPTPADELWQFWADATGTQVVDVRGAGGEFATLAPPAGDPWVKLQAVGDGGGVHLDLDVEDPSAAALFAIGLGAREVFRYPGDGYVVLRSPGGFVFCLTTWHGAARQERGSAVLLDQLCLDIPADQWETECAFWGALMGIEPVTGSMNQFRVLPRPRHQPVRILLQRKDTEGGVVTGHPDLACADRARTRAEHEGLGARHTAEWTHWSVMTAPGGQVYCLTDRRPATGTL